MEVKSIGIIHSAFQQAAGTPVQPVFAEGTEGIVEVFDEYAQGLKDLGGFERIWLIYWFDRCRDYNLAVTPYMDSKKRGLFATRAPARPNPIGMSAVGLEKIEGNKIHVRQIDILDGTPLLDIKPYSPKFDCFEVSRSGWLQNAGKGSHKADGRFHR